MKSTTHRSVILYLFGKPYPQTRVLNKALLRQSFTIHTRRGLCTKLQPPQSTAAPQSNTNLAARAHLLTQSEYLVWCHE